MRLKVRSLIIAAVGLHLGCQSGPRLHTPPAPLTADAAIQATVFLIGDAGGAKPGDQVLGALAAELQRRSGDATVIFLGDNVYPKGIPPAGHPGRAEAERRLRAQVGALRGTDAQGVFIPGNHDWARSGSDGWATVGRQESVVAAEGLEQVRLLPAGGCPGPEIIAVTPGLRLIVLDTQWWLHPNTKPVDPVSACAADSVSEVMAAVRDALASDSSLVGVVAHHPPASGGVHGGHFGVLDHVFPLRALNSWLWLPLPIIGSAYPIARMAGISDQDLSGARYRLLSDSLRAAFADLPVAFYAAGHEHNLQVIADSTFGHVLVSGAGYFGHTTRVVYLDESRYAAAASGYMRLDVLTDGRMRLAVVEVNGAAQVRESFTMWLREVDRE